MMNFSLAYLIPTEDRTANPLLAAIAVPVVKVPNDVRVDGVGSFDDDDPRTAVTIRTMAAAVLERESRV